MAQVLVDMSSVDWKLLRVQKHSLVDVIANASISKSSRFHLEGILHIIDHIQDEAVNSGIWTEHEVFGKLKEE